MTSITYGHKSVQRSTPIDPYMQPPFHQPALIHWPSTHHQAVGGVRQEPRGKCNVGRKTASTDTHNFIKVKYECMKPNHRHRFCPSKACKCVLP